MDQVQVLAHDQGSATCTGKICRTSLLVSEHVTDFDVESILTFETLPYIASGFDSHDDTWCIHNLRQPERADGAAIDHDLGVAIAYSRTLRAAFINHCAPHGAATSAGITLPYVWHADICNSNFLADYGMISTNVWAISSPCTSWSESGKNAELHSRGDETPPCRCADADQCPGSNLSAATDHLRTRGRFQRPSPFPSRLRALECDGAFDLADAPTAVLHSSK